MTNATHLVVMMKVAGETLSNGLTTLFITLEKEEMYGFQRT